MNSETEHQEIKNLLAENQRLLAENNALLKKMHRNSIFGFWLNIAWIFFFLVLPLLALYKFVMPLYGAYSSPQAGLESQLQNLGEVRSLLEQTR